MKATICCREWRGAVVWALLVTLAIGAGPSTVTGAPLLRAQSDEDHPLWAMLAFVPDAPEVREAFVDYVDYATFYGTLGPVPADDAAWEALLQDDASRPAFRRLVFGAEALAAAFASRDAAIGRDVVGFGVADVQRALVFGTPPNNGVVYGGAWQSEDVVRAHEARQYVAETRHTLTVLVHPDDPGGTRINPLNRDRGNLFDPLTGRTPPVGVLPGHVFSAFGLATFNAVTQAAAGNRPSLADAAGTRALAEALTDVRVLPGDLMQALFVGLGQVANIVGERPATDSEIPDEIRAIIPETRQSELWASYGTLPIYFGVAFADKQDGDTQVSVIALLYPDEATAQAGATELAQRLEMFAVQPGQPPLLSTLAGAKLETVVTTSEATGFSVAVVAVRVPSDAEVMPLRAWLNAVISRQFAPLWFIVQPSD